MTPEQRKIQELEQQVKILTDFMMSFDSAAMLSPNATDTITRILSSASSKTAASGTRAVNEGGSGTYNVMYPPDGFIRIGGFNVPYIN